ncbi:MAG: SDR family oxidoreductase [Anaerolineales bacterium]
MMRLEKKTVLITGAAKRVGRAMALAVAEAGGNVIVHYRGSQQAAEQTKADIQTFGVQAHLLQADLSDPQQAAGLIPRALEFGPLFGLINNASVFAPLSVAETDLKAWELHINVHATAPFLLSQAFAASRPPAGRIVNMLDWRALRPGGDHFPYTISKATLVALTRSLAQALAPDITVNGMALGAILPPSDGGDTKGILKDYPAGRWASLDEVTRTLLFLLDGPAYITGEIIHVDGGRHLV